MKNCEVRMADAVIDFTNVKGTWLVGSALLHNGKIIHLNGYVQIGTYHLTEEKQIENIILNERYILNN
jgi:hypothetical protein